MMKLNITKEGKYICYSTKKTQEKILETFIAILILKEMLGVCHNLES